MNSNSACQDEPRDELINGQIVMMSPRPSNSHCTVAENLFFIFRKHLQGRTCRPLADGRDVYLTKKDRFVPDFMVVCNPKKIQPKGIFGAPDLVAEVLSPSTAHRDRSYKKDVYEQAGVKEYWIVSTAEKSVEQYLLQDGRFALANTYTQYPDYLLEDMTEEELAALVTEFKCSLYDDLLIKLADIFEYVD